MSLELNDLIGKTVTEVKGAHIGSDKMLLLFSDGTKCAMYHSQDCCESVSIESIVGDPQDLVGEPLLVSELVAGETPNDFKFEYEPDSYSWTFIKFATRKGYVDIRWLGESNGYYGEEPAIDIL